jgi:hypothetical protein
VCAEAFATARFLKKWRLIPKKILSFPELRQNWTARININININL